MRTRAVFNFIFLIIAVLVSYLGNSMAWNGNTVGSLSKQYENLFTPAGYAFSIWGFIFLSLFAYSLFQLKRAFSGKKDVDFIKQSGWWFCIANLANAAWIVAWLYEYTLLSVVIMLLILFSLIRIIQKTAMELWDAPLKIIVFTWWPICFYSGWITVAAIANISAYLAKIGWNAWGISEITWTLFLIVAVTFINILVIFKRNMREFALVGVWALFALFVRHQGSINSIAFTALAGAGLLLLLIAYHGYKNRETNPFAQLRKS